MNAALVPRVRQKKVRPERSTMVWCGSEGFLSVEELKKRTEEGIAAYAKMQPLRFRSAMVNGKYRGAKIYNRTPLRVSLAQPNPEVVTNDNPEEGSEEGQQ
jgi:hypothetical protein